MKPKLYVVTGAPGSGKSAALDAFVRLRTPYLAFDIDWLGVVASDLAGRSIFFDRSKLGPYGALWFEVLHSVFRNGRVAVFFTPNDPSDFEAIGLPAWCSGVEWLLLDCAATWSGPTDCGLARDGRRLWSRRRSKTRAPCCRPSPRSLIPPNIPRPRQRTRSCPGWKR
ncbi:MAG: hypothetical protein WKH64_13850 [Chloroflexia bacterium]